MYPDNMGSSQIFREDFTSRQSVVDNGGTIEGNPTINNGITPNADGDGVDKSHLLSEILSANEITVIGRVVVGTDNDYRTLFQVRDEGQPDTRIEVGLNNTDNKMYAYTGSGVVASSSVIATGDRVLGWSFDGTNVSFYADGALISTAVLSLGSTVQGQTVKLLTRGATSGNDWNTKVYRIEAFRTAFTAEEMKDDFENDTYEEVDAGKAAAYMPLRSHYNDGVNEVTENIGTAGNMILGNGLGNNEPTQLFPHGLAFGGAAYGRILDHPDLDFESGQDFSLEFALGEITDTGAAMCVIQKVQGNGTLTGSAGNFGWDVLLRMDSVGNPISFRLRDTDDITSSLTAAYDFATPGLKHVVCTFKSGGRLNVYVNGNLISGADDALTAGVENTGDAYIGGINGAFFLETDFFSQPVIHREALTPRQIRWMHNRLLSELNN